MKQAHVIAIDGPSGCGKGTSGLYVAKFLQFNYLDSGKYYRGVALKSKLLGVNPDDVDALEKIAQEIDIKISEQGVLLDMVDYTKIICTEEIGTLASIVGKHPRVRNAIHVHELGLRKYPGLVADGRDAGRVFDTPYRFFIKTDVRVRAAWRLAQLREKGDTKSTYDMVLKQLEERDYTDINRAANPLMPHEDSIIIDNTHFKDRYDTGKLILKHYLEMITSYA